MLLRKVARMLNDWWVLCKEDELENLDKWSHELEKSGSSPPMLSWIAVISSNAEDLCQILA